MNKIKIEIEGTYAVSNGMVTVTAPNGKTRSTQVGESPTEAIAKMMLREIVSGH